jgi:hypothetical protein
VAWGSPRAGPPMGKEGGVRCARSGIRMLPAKYVKGEPPAYCLSCVAVRRGTACSTYRTCNGSGSRPNALMLPLVPAPSQGLVEPAVRVYVYRRVVR